MEPGKRIQWHTAFCSAIKLELIQNKETLSYESEHGINSKPIVIDLLVITLSQEINIVNEIGHIFKKHNILEYKSAEDRLNIDTFFKVLGYACLYKAHAPTVDGIKADEISISLVRQGKPKKLFAYFRKNGIRIEQVANGIYYIHGQFFFAMQIIVTRELDQKEHIWLTSLTNNLSAEQAETLVDSVNGLVQKDDREYADSVLNAAMHGNKSVFDQSKEVFKMCEALRELMKDEIEEELAKAREKAISEGRAEGHAKGHAEGHAKGHAEGHAKGLEEGRAESSARILELETKLLKYEKIYGLI